MSDDLRARIYDAVLSVLGPGSPEGDPHPDAEPITDEVIAVLDEEFRPPLVVDFSTTGLSPEQVAEWTRLYTEAARGPLKILPPNASDLRRRRTPAERRAYLEAHRDEATARGIPEDLVNLMMQDAENSGE